MLMITEPKGNLEQVYEATTPAEIVREQQRYPFKGWYAVIVRSGREQDAADHFRLANVLAYWPNYERRVATSRGRGGFQRQRHVHAAIIPRMIFCPTADEYLFWAATKRIPYVIDLLRKEEGKIATLANSDIEILRLIEAGLNLPPTVIPVHNFKIGQKVRFNDDNEHRWPPGKIIRLSNDGRISVEVYAMGRMTPIHSVLPSQLEAM